MREVTETPTLADYNIHPDRLRGTLHKLKTQAEKYFPSDLRVLHTQFNIAIHLSQLALLRQKVDSTEGKERQRWLQRLSRRQARCPIRKVTLQSAFDLGLYSGQQINTLQETAFTRREVTKNKKRVTLDVFFSDLLIMAKPVLDVLQAQGDPAVNWCGTTVPGGPEGEVTPSLTFQGNPGMCVPPSQRKTERTT